jgi:hypothetical protein
MAWQIVADKTTDYFLKMNEDDGSYEVLPDGSHKPIYTTSAVAKWDGCVHLYRYYNGQSFDHDCPGDADYMHICDLDMFIQSLIDLKRTATQFYADKGGAEYWPENEK